ncbi:type III secretion effector protein [Pseudomonas syringae]|uniref:Type III secretion effector protein n=1 Tax=Pseudomonas syringae TaxID=317 RepID=A0A9Q3X455_PSESX|nr:type III secretion effector protein [Pseudomonas syringae]MCF5062272.1 type III secretion effector protein [Pseudomonas syringae]MCF5073067.1 type III secretion effector protein [Pseudomonas syringae]MCF5118860.1 type III secretion effector protein [Pseudomonas syringae]MCF5378623.1 type III secretion effector protein [Pseudomonas syringae]
MRAFAGQTKFQAPVADDFSRGMFADGQNPGGNVMKHRGLINGLTAWWRKQTLD